MFQPAQEQGAQQKQAEQHGETDNDVHQNFSGRMRA